MIAAWSSTWSCSKVVAMETISLTYIGIVLNWLRTSKSIIHIIFSEIQFTFATGSNLPSLLYTPPRAPKLALYTSPGVYSRCYKSTYSYGARISSISFNFAIDHRGFNYCQKNDENITVYFTRFFYRFSKTKRSCVIIIQNGIIEMKEIYVWTVNKT